MKLIDYKTMEERIKALEEKVNVFSERAKKHDEEATFPFDNFKDLKEIGYPALTVPQKYGGLGISLYELLTYQETIAKADGSTALSIGWHMGITKHMGENDIWEEEKYAAFAHDVVETGALLNNAASEPATGSPTRGGKPETVAKKSDSGWVINGRKTFTTMAPILDYFVVSASIDGTENVGNFLIKRERNGVSIDETWDSIAMRGSGSHDLLLGNVHVEDGDLVEYLTPGKKRAAGWLLHIPTCYLGIARAAQEYAVDFAATYSPNSIEGTISELPNVKQKLGEMELLLMESEHFLYGVARKWDESDEEARQAMKPELGAVKLSVVNKAVEVVDLAMRVAGARSLSRQNPLQRYYRDVRAGLHNPPMDDMTVMQLAGKSVAERG
ncbi:acyl-CoA/acyl-ACP dehydrogenase [Virgibacillus sp. NKC19-16]|uniref:acyl-CoA dehydrogenase family protein n=1 Tax=Virgibacillus salidurans TaxID=2831673 RepID=UPI001F24CA12|nr:acyl-CoA dehydrogenase family protein [Virgibacillus sp. NKC19-16]UJL45459.1 acyl-CoA/acyl-ACP dehydrogenase [Virgibacillus sp. NKC19-16]